MSVDSTVALVNLIVQAALIVGALGGAILGKRRRFRRHCLSMRILMAVQILTIALVMAPSMAGYLDNLRGFSWLLAEIIIHHLLGLALLGLWIYINLAELGIARRALRFSRFMWAALVVWLASLATGVHLYVYIWT